MFYFDACNHISGRAEATVDGEYIKCLAFNDKTTPYWAWSESREPFFKLFPNHIFGSGEARHFKFRVLIGT